MIALHGYYLNAEDVEFIYKHSSDHERVTMDPMFCYFIIIFDSEVDAMHFKLAYPGKTCKLDSKPPVRKIEKIKRMSKLKAYIMNLLKRRKSNGQL